MLVGLNSVPQCFAGQSLSLGSDGEYTCRTTWTQETFGVAAPNCQYGAPYLDNAGNWQCPQPPQPSQGEPGGISLFLLAAATALLVWWYFGKKASGSIARVSKGDISSFLPSF